MRLRKRGFYHYESWRLATYLALPCWRTVVTTGVRLEASTRPKKKTASASALTPRQVESRRPAVGSGVKTRVRTNEIQPRHEFLNPAPNPEKKTKRKTFGFVVMYSDFLWRQFDVHQVSTDVQDWMLATRRRRQRSRSSLRAGRGRS